MKIYTVSFDIKGKMEVVVEAEDEDEAIERAWEDSTIDNIYEWEPVMSSAEVTCEEDEEAEESE